jgi:hypothetical protein
MCIFTAIASNAMSALKKSAGCCHDRRVYYVSTNYNSQQVGFPLVTFFILYRRLFIESFFLNFRSEGGGKVQKNVRQRGEKEKKDDIISCSFSPIFF